MKALVLGGTRFIGAAAVRALVDAGWEVACFHRGRTHADLPDGVHHIHGDRAELARHGDALRDFGPEVALDMLGLTEAGTRAVAAALRGIVSRVVVASSCDVYRCFDVIHGHEPDLVPAPALEEGPLRRGRYPYRAARAPDDPDRWRDDYDKLLVEAVYLEDPAFGATVVRLPMVYGPGDYQHRTFPYLKRMRDGRQVVLLERQQAGWRACRGYVDDVGRALALAAARPAGPGQGRVYNVAEEEPPTEAEWAAGVGAACGWPGEVRVVPDGALQGEDGLRFAQDLTVSSARIREELGYAERVDRAEALRRTVAWELDHPPERVDPAAFDYAAEDALLARLEAGVAEDSNP